MADVIEEAWRQGAKFDAWSEYFDFDRWMAAFGACGLDPAFYANRVREKDEVLPWSVTSTGRDHALPVAGAGAGLSGGDHPRLPGTVYRLRGGQALSGREMRCRSID